MTAEISRDELVGQVADLVLRVVAEITERWEEVIAGAGLASPQVKLLRHLLTNGDTTMGGIAEHLACDPSLATVAVDRLERRGLVIRVPDDSDRRVRRVRLSPEGETKVRTVWSQMADATPLARLGDQQLEAMQGILGAMLRQ